MAWGQFSIARRTRCRVQHRAFLERPGSGFVDSDLMCATQASWTQWNWTLALLPLCVYPALYSINVDLQNRNGTASA